MTADPLNPYRAIERDCPSRVGSSCWCVVTENEVVTRHLISEADARAEVARLFSLRPSVTQR